ncbi:Uncharacterised protein [Legionella beliardensis]|uniref:Uncharacterized protein n=1 Tax=Legionella beliardensis TaxID=91822 RepID=A0A378HZ20_9GAMM|nr:hypothetical protein [Legionella beliardensis]STX27992.1 Uncharacterised protein [Legionella beliardensis]
MFEDDKHIGFKRSPEAIKDPDIEINSIMNRAHHLAKSQAEPQDQHNNQLNQEDSMKEQQPSM